MKLKLIQSGGLAGKPMTATVSGKLKEEEWAELAKLLRKKSSMRGSAMRDAFHYTLQRDDDEQSNIVIDINTIPEKHQALFQLLFEKLKAEK